MNNTFKWHAMDCTMSDQLVENTTDNWDIPWYNNLIFTVVTGVIKVCQNQIQIKFLVVAHCFLSEEEFKKYYRMPGWGKPLYKMKEAEIPKGEIPSAFDWRDKGKPGCIFCLVYLAVVVYRALLFEHLFYCFV